MQARDSVLIVIPTYNERENIGVLVRHLRQIVPQADVLIVDDNSPDGTGELADALVRADPQSIHVLHRAGKTGLGRAYVAGLGWGLARGYEWLVQMDADLSHDPRAVLRLLGRAHGKTGPVHDLVLGSRYVPGGETRNWRWPRRFLSRLGSASARRLLRLPYRDLTGGFKCWRRAALQAIDLGTIRSSGYAFQIEMTHSAARCGATIAEEPIIFTERKAGQSKMNRAIVWEAMTMVLRLRQEEGRAAASSRQAASRVGLTPRGSR